MKNLIPLGECWHDSTLERIIIEYDTISVEIETDKKPWRLNCHNFIGIEYLGQRDENVIKRIDISEQNEIISKVASMVSEDNCKGEGINQIDMKWKWLGIELLDGVIISIVCESINLDN